MQVSITQYCTIHNVDRAFINALADEGLIILTIESEEPFIEEDQLPELESYTRWHYDMGVNMEGIDVIRHLLKRMKQMQAELESFRNRLRFYEQ